uniref:NADH dehydrogenase subunit 6 n=1 Tax=Siphonosoma cumanense TaxID=6444 RepID=A0A7D4ZW77_SIPCU|nr:NADH dehydrogenase subunit 6 [Siphonosoma cumanense]QKS32596.1 NADH dehydrogenase subunit 6 [Siphonosoma cumanense]
MFFLLLMSLLISFSLVLPLALSPLMLGVWILMMSAWAASLIALSLSSWLGMTTILIYIGGLNVLFAYFAATSPNQFLFSRNLFMSMTFLLISTFFNTILYPPMPFHFSTSLSHITKLYFSFESLSLVFLALVLFIALIAVVKIASRHHGPLRPFS